MVNVEEIFFVNGRSVLHFFLCDEKMKIFSKNIFDKSIKYTSYEQDIYYSIFCKCKVLYFRIEFVYLRPIIAEIIEIEKKRRLFHPLSILVWEGEFFIYLGSVLRNIEKRNFLRIEM